MDPATRIAGWEHVQAALAQLKENSDAFEQFCAEQLAELESLHAQLIERQQAQDRQRASWDEELQTARVQLGRLASVAVDLADARAELAGMRGELLEERQRLAASQAEVAHLQKRAQELVEENRHLETVIVDVRHQAEDQKRRVAEERAEWIGDLLRSALDMQSHLITDQDQADAKNADLKVVHHDRDSAHHDAPAVKIDPVLNAVMAQFEQLQKGRPAGKSGSRQGVA